LGSLVARLACGAARRAKLPDFQLGGGEGALESVDVAFEGANTIRSGGEGLF